MAALRRPILLESGLPRAAAKGERDDEQRYGTQPLTGLPRCHGLEAAEQRTIEPIQELRDENARKQQVELAQTLVLPPCLQWRVSLPTH